MSRDRGRLASPLGALRPEYDVVVVGSGYGGAVTAARLAQARKSVCVLERGRELRPGDYPDTLRGALREFQIDLPDRHLFSPSALYDLRVNPDMSVFVGCGLGGTSLINANVALPTPARDFEDAAWPVAIRTAAGAMSQWFETAGEMLGVQAYPCTEEPRKLRLFRRLARPGDLSDLAPVTVTFPRSDDDTAPRRNRAGVMQHPCTGCGDCVSGCNYAAKSTLIMNYLPVAKRHHAAIFTEMKVSVVEPIAGADGDRARWRVHVDPLGSGRERFGARPLSVAAHTVILAAGALGSTEILFRSKKAGLGVSGMLGRKFSGNGDTLAFSYNNRDPSNAVGFGARSPHGWEAPGPCISGYIERRDLQGRLTILLEDGVIPGALSSTLSVGFVVARLLGGRDRQTPPAARGASIWRLLDRWVRGGASSTQTFLAMVDDPGYGELVEGDGRIRVRWSDAGSAQAYRDLEAWLIDAAARAGGAYVPSPFGRITVHPLGGCVMADSAAEGVVDDSGRVFDGNGGVHEGLYVCDASIIPRPLGRNPLLTIAALAERAASSIGPRVR